MTNTKPMPNQYLCGIVNTPNKILTSVYAYTVQEAALEYTLAYEGGWDGDHFNLGEINSASIQVIEYSKGSIVDDVSCISGPLFTYFQIELAVDSDDEYVITEISDLVTTHDKYGVIEVRSEW